MVNVMIRRIKMMTYVVLFFLLFGNAMLEASSDQSPRQCSLKALEYSIEDVITILKQLQRLNMNDCKDVLARTDLQNGHKHSKMVSFTAVMKASHSLGSAEKVPYDHVISNIGSGYDVKARVFTAPISGIYTISASMMANPTNEVRLKLMKDGKDICWIYTHNKGHFVQSSQTVNLPLKKGSKTWVQQASGSLLWLKEPYNVFSAALIAEGHV